MMAGEWDEMADDDEDLEYRVFADWDCDPVFRDGMVDLDSLDITPYLRDQLRAWNRRWELLAGSPPDRGRHVIDREGGRRWLRDGQALADRLQQELGPHVVVRFDGRAPGLR